MSDQNKTVIRRIEYYYSQDNTTYWINVPANHRILAEKLDYIPIKLDIYKICDCGAEKANTLHASWCSNN